MGLQFWRDKMTIMKIELPNGNGMEKTLPFGGLPIEFLEGFDAAIGMLAGFNQPYKITLDVNILIAKDAK
jgi:hypothetical protein